MKKSFSVLLCFMILIGCAVASTGDYQWVTKSGLSSVSSLSVYSPNYAFNEYVKETYNSSSDVVCKAYGRNDAVSDYDYITGTKLTVDNLESASKNFTAYYDHVKVTLSGLGKGEGKITAR